VRGGYLSSEREPDGGADSLASLASLATVPFSLPSSPMVMSFRACDLCGAASSQAVESDVFSGGDSAEDDERAKARGARAVLGTMGAAAARPTASEPLGAELGADDAARRSCQRALLRLLTTVDNAGPLEALGAEHPVLGAVHVRPLGTQRRTEHVRPLGTRAPYRARTPSLASSWAEVSTGGGWLQEHRGDLGRCLPSLLVVGSQRSGLG
jgi:hypothetical protein